MTLQPILCCAFAVPVPVPSESPAAQNGDMPVSSTKTVNDIIAYWRATERVGDTYTARSFAGKNYYAEIFGLDLGERLAESVTVADILEWFATKPSERWAAALGKRKRKRDWSRGTKKNVSRTIFHLFKLAEDDGLIDRHRLRSLSKRFEDGDQIRALSEDEYRMMWDHASDERWRRYIEFIRWTGARPGEAAALKWPMIDWDICYAIMHEHKTAKKTKRPRKIPLSTWVIEMLCELEAQARDRAGGADPTGYVFLNERGTKWTSQSCTKRLETIRNRSGLAADGHLHGIRKLFASWLASLGVPPKIIAEILGHTSAQITEDTYIKFNNYMHTVRDTVNAFQPP